jgi:hypothetical protein
MVLDGVHWRAFSKHVNESGPIKTGNFFVRFQIFTAASMKMTTFWDIAPCSLVEIDRRFSGAY